MSSFDEIEERRERVDGLVYEESRERPIVIDRDPGDEDAYDISDYKHPDHYETLVEVWDNRDPFMEAA